MRFVAKNSAAVGLSPSWPGLTRPSIFLAKSAFDEEMMDPRVKPGGDAGGAFYSETTAPPRALFHPKVQRGGFSMWTARVLLAAVLVVCVASSADAWRRHHGSYADGERSSARTLDEWRARQAQGQI